MVKIKKTRYVVEKDKKIVSAHHYKKEAEKEVVKLTVPKKEVKAVLSAEDTRWLQVKAQKVGYDRETNQAWLNEYFDWDKWRRDPKNKGKVWWKTVIRLKQLLKVLESGDWKKHGGFDMRCDHTKQELRGIKGKGRKLWRSNSLMGISRHALGHWHGCHAHLGTDHKQHTKREKYVFKRESYSQNQNNVQECIKRIKELLSGKV